MDKKILKEISDIKNMMGLTESEVDEQAFQGIKSGIKKGLDKAKEVITKSPEDTKEKDLGDYNGKPISEILEEIKEKNSRNGTIDVNGETLHFGVGRSMNQNISSDKAATNARESFGTGEHGGTSTEMKKVFFENNEYITYILMKKF